MGLAAQWWMLPLEAHQERYSQYNVPMVTTPQIETPLPTDRHPYHLLPGRDVDPSIAARLNSELRDGKHELATALVPLGLRFVKILGAGSQGTAVLFEVDDNGTTRKVVAKYSSVGPQQVDDDDVDQDDDHDDDDDSMAMEKEWMRVSEDAPFIHGVLRSLHRASDAPGHISSRLI